MPANTKPLISDRVLLKLRNVVNRTMTYTCTVKRGASPGASGGYNQPPKPTSWAYYLTGQKCNVTQLIAFRYGEQQNKDTAMVIDRYKMDLPYGTDVKVTDQIYDLKDRAGNLIDSSVKFYDVKELIPSEISLSVQIQAIH